MVCDGSSLAGSGGSFTPAQQLSGTGKLFLFVLLAASDPGVRVQDVVVFFFNTGLHQESSAFA